MLGPGGWARWAIVIVDTWMWTPFVMLICLAGLRSIPPSIYEAAECDRASKWRQFWTITIPLVLPFLMLAVLFRGIENFKMFDLVVQLTGGGPGKATNADGIATSAQPGELHLALGLLAGEGGQWDEALAELRRATELMPGNTQARRNLDALLRRLGQPTR